MALSLRCGTYGPVHMELYWGHGADVFYSVEVVSVNPYLLSPVSQMHTPINAIVTYMKC